MNKNNRFDSDIRGRRYKNKQFRKVISNFPSQFYFADLIDWTKKRVLQILLLLIVIMDTNIFLLLLMLIQDIVG